MEREPLLYRTVSISKLSEIEPLLLASIVGGYMLTPYDFSNCKCNNEDDDNYLQVCVLLCMCVYCIVYNICDVYMHVCVCLSVSVCFPAYVHIILFLADLF